MNYLEAISSPVSTELTNCGKYYTYRKEDVDTIEHEIRTLEIILRNGLNMPHKSLIMSSDTYEEYAKAMYKARNDFCEVFKFEIKYSEEEFNLLKGIL